MIGSALMVVAGTNLATEPIPRTEWFAFAGVFIVLGSAAFVGEWFLSFVDWSFWDQRFVVPFPDKADKEKSRGETNDSANAA